MDIDTETDKRISNPISVAEKEWGAYLAIILLPDILYFSLFFIDLSDLF
jgi:hypothetical protein